MSSSVISIHDLLIKPHYRDIAQAFVNNDNRKRIFWQFLIQFPCPMEICFCPPPTFSQRSTPVYESISIYQISSKLTFWLSDSFSAMLIILKLHVLTLCQLGIATFNSSAVADIRRFINFFMLMSPL